VNREGTLHVVQIAKAAPKLNFPRYQVGFADYSSPGGAMKMKEIIGEHGLKDFFTSIGVQPMMAESVLRGLETEGSASVLSVILPEEMLIRLGLADPKERQVFSVRFTIFRGPAGPILAYCLDAPFVSVTFSSKSGARYPDMESLIRKLDSVGLPGKEVARVIGPRYFVTAEQLVSLGLKPPPEW
jgi:hypothetical protein